MSIALFFGIGEHSAAIAQQVTASFPVVAKALPSAVPALAAALPAPVQPLARGNILTLPLRAAPIAVIAPVQPLAAMVEAQAAGDLDEQSQCLATAVYFESMGEPLEGQLAVAQVVINRARSGRYPTDWCGVVKQKAQFSFVRSGRFPHINAGCQAWRKAQAIARIAANNLATTLPADVLWYHANYVSPTWRRNLTRVEQIGAHIFYRA